MDEKLLKSWEAEETPAMSRNFVIEVENRVGTYPPGEGAPSFRKE